MRKSILLYVDSLDILDCLSDEQAGSLFKAIRAHIKGETIQLDPIVNIAFIPIKNNLDRDADRYARVCERNKANGIKGGRPKKPTGLSGNPNEPTGLSGNPKNPTEPNNNNNSNSNSNINKKRKKEERGALDFSCWPSMPSDQTMTDWLSMRRTMKAKVTQTVINRFATKLKAAHLAGYTVDDCLGECVARGWKGFDVSWIDDGRKNNGGIDRWLANQGVENETV